MVRLTMKQELFAQKLEESFTQIDAYKEAYCVDNMTDKTACEKASILANNVKIRTRREELRAPVLEKIHYGIEEHLKKLEQLSGDAANAGQFAAAINAEISRGKAAGLYVEKVDVAGGGIIAPSIIEIVVPELEEKE